MDFKLDDKVEVTAEVGNTKGQRGTVTKVFSETNGFLVKLETGRVAGYFQSELVLVDPEREAVIELADTLDKARQQAKALPVLSGQAHVYTMCVDALVSTLSYLAEGSQCQRIYNDMVQNGSTVREAIKAVGE